MLQSARAVRPLCAAPARRAPPPRATLAPSPSSAWDATYGAPLPHGVSLAQGPRDEMEDVALVVPRGRCGYLVAAVLDGHAGGAAARWLADALYPALADALVKAGGGGGGGVDAAAAAAAGSDLCCPADLAPPLASAFSRLDASLLRHLASLPDPEERDAGSTATVILAGKGRVVAANVGDFTGSAVQGGRSFRPHFGTPR